MLLRHDAGERVWSVLHEPTPEDEDDQASHRLRQTGLVPTHGPV
jgi:hypothetical protein